jgi:MSHA biogenesis protein MshN
MKHAVKLAAETTTPQATKPPKPPPEAAKPPARPRTPLPATVAATPEIAAPRIVKTSADRVTASPPVVPEAQAKLERSVTPAQQSDSLYKQAASLLQQGNGIDARPLLRQALDANPSNGNARQLLATLYVESKNLVDAAALLREGTRLNPERSDMWMKLARLELEQGDPAAALAHLEAGLPAASDDAAYHGFYAALLQRAQRHGDAVSQYVVALRGDPSVPNWLVGLAISLQALGRSTEAADALQRALDSGRLSAPLRAYVEERLDQLKR